jgi:uncharacterized coiled-coil protein SlyX
MISEILEIIERLQEKIKALQQTLIDERKLSFDQAKEIERLNRVIAENNDKDDGK